MKILSAIINLFCQASALWPHWPPSDRITVKVKISVDNAAGKIATYRCFFVTERKGNRCRGWGVGHFFCSAAISG